MENLVQCATKVNWSHPLLTLVPVDLSLQCNHVGTFFAVRKCHSLLPEYDESLCAERWKLQYFLSNHHAYLPNNLSNSDVDSMDISMHFSEPMHLLYKRNTEKHSKWLKTFASNSLFRHGWFWWRNEGPTIGGKSMGVKARRSLFERQQVCITVRTLCQSYNNM